MIKSRNIDPSAAARYFVIENVYNSTAALTATALGIYTFPQVVTTQSRPAIGSLPSFGKIVDVLVGQTSVGVGGTSYTVNILNNGTTIFATNPVIALASGVTSFDTQGLLALPTGATRGVLTATTANLLLKKGSQLSVTTTVTGVYGTAASITVAVVIDTYPV